MVSFVLSTTLTIQWSLNARVFVEIFSFSKTVLALKQYWHYKKEYFEKNEKRLSHHFRNLTKNHNGFIFLSLCDFCE